MEAILTIVFGRDLDSQSNEGKRLSECLGMLGGKNLKWGLIGMSTILLNYLGASSITKGITTWAKLVLCEENDG